MKETAQIEKATSSTQTQTEKRLFTFFFWTSLVPIILLFFLWNNSTTAILEKNALARQKSLAEQKHSQLALFAEKIKENTSAWSTDGVIRQLTDEINLGSCKTEYNKLSSEPNNLSLCKTSKELSAYLRGSKMALDTSVLAVDVLDVEGIVIASNDPNRIGADRSGQKNSFKEAKALPFGEAIFYPELISENDAFGGRPMIHLSAPITSTDNKRLVGVLLLHIGTEKLNNVISENVGFTTEGYLVGKNKIMITPSRFDPNAIMKQVVDTVPTRECAIRNAPFNGEYTDYHGMSVLGASICDQNLFGTLVVETDKDEFFKDINKIRSIALAVLFIIFILIFAFIYFSSANIIRGLRHIFPSTFSSNITLIIIVFIIILSTIGISFVFAKSVREFIEGQKVAVITSLVAQQADRHINHQSTSAFAEWQSLNSQQKFTDFSDEVLRSFQSVLGVQLHTTEGILVFSTFQSNEVGKKIEAEEVSRTMTTGGITSSDVLSSYEAKLGSTSIIGVYMPLLGRDDDIVGVAETYIDVNEISLFTQNIQTVLWVGVLVALIFIFLLLRFVFRVQDEKIIAREEELSGVIEHSPIGICTIMKDGTIANINPAMLSELGVASIDDLRNKRFFSTEEYMHSDLPDLIDKALGGEPFDKEIEIISQHSASKKYYHYYGVPLRDSDGNVGSILLISDNTTERKKLENEVREYAKGIEGEYRATLTGLDSSAIVSITDEKGTITYANKKFVEISKYSAEELVGQNHRILKSGEHPPEFYREMWDAISSGKIWRGEIKNKAKDGNFYWVDSTIVPILGYDGKPKNYVSIRILISDRKAAEQRLKEYLKEIEESKIKSEALLASLGEGMIATGNTGLIIAMNQVAEEMLGWDKADIIGIDASLVIHPKDESGTSILLGQETSLQAITGAGTINRGKKIFFTRKDGTSIPVAITETPVTIDKKNAGSVIIFRDITAENEVEKTRRDLLSLASHQLRTPLSGTKWLIETLKRGIHGPLTKEQGEYLNEIYKINERMTTLVHDMLSVLRMEGDIAQAKKEKVSIATLFEVLFETLGATAKNKNISLKLEKTDETEIETDSLLLRNILENLISNAINYSQNNSEVLVGVVRNEDNITFSVKDSGIGIPRDEQKQIFERFYRASNAKTYDTHGTGLGLYVSATLAKKIGARISFESEKDKGATFYLSIPSRKMI